MKGLLKKGFCVFLRLYLKLHFSSVHQSILKIFWYPDPLSTDHTVQYFYFDHPSSQGGQTSASGAEPELKTAPGTLTGFRTEADLSPRL